MKKNTKDRSSIRVKILTEKHRELDDLVDSMSSQKYLTPKEYHDLKVLKVKRLRCKDAIEEIKKETH